MDLQFVAPWWQNQSLPDFHSQTQKLFLKQEGASKHDEAFGLFRAKKVTKCVWS